MLKSECYDSGASEQIALRQVCPVPGQERAGSSEGVKARTKREAVHIQKKEKWRTSRVQWEGRGHSGGRNRGWDIEDAQASAALDKAKKSLEEGVRLLAERQKLIKLAGRSEHGRGALMAWVHCRRIGWGQWHEKRIFNTDVGSAQ